MKASYAAAALIHCLVLSHGFAQQSAAPLRMTAHAESRDQSNPNTLSAPVLGLLTDDSSTEVRAIVGVPGSAMIDDPVTLPANTGRIFLAPSARWSLIEKADGSGLALLAFDGQTAGDLIGIDGSAATASLVAFSPK